MPDIKIYNTVYHIPDIGSEVIRRSDKTSAVVAAIGSSGGFIDVVIAGKIHSYLTLKFAEEYIIDFEPTNENIKKKKTNSPERYSAHYD